MKNVTTYAEAIKQIESIKEVRKGLRSQEKELNGAMEAVNGISKYDIVKESAANMVEGLQKAIDSIQTQLAFSEEELNKARKVAWHLKKAEELMASEPELVEEAKEA